MSESVKVIETFDCRMTGLRKTGRCDPGCGCRSETWVPASVLAERDALREAGGLLATLIVKEEDECRVC